MVLPDNLPDMVRAPQKALTRSEMIEDVSTQLSAIKAELQAVALSAAALAAAVRPAAVRSMLNRVETEKPKPLSANVIRSIRGKLFGHGNK